MRVYRIFPETVWKRGESRKTFKAGRKRGYSTPTDVFDEKFSSLRAATDAAHSSVYDDLVVCKRLKNGRWQECAFI